jgi:hypothetical protein
MRKLASILLILLLLFNVLGYYGLFLGLNYQNKQQLIQRLDLADYNESEAVTLRIPISIPYAIDAKEFERVDGEFEHQGEYYHLVKQRLSQDTLYIVCIKDNNSKRIHQALEDYVKTFTDNPAGGTNSVKVIPTFIKEYVSASFEMKHISSGWVLPVNNSSFATVFIDSFTASIIHPPERV